MLERHIPMVGCGTAIGLLVGDIRPALAERRDGLAHGDPFAGLPAHRLLELACDLIKQSADSGERMATGLGTTFRIGASRSAWR